MEICTVLGGGEEHAYLRLKDKKGQVYSVGKFWDRNIELPGFLELVKTALAMLRMDYHDYRPEEKYFKKTIK